MASTKGNEKVPLIDTQFDTASIKTLTEDVEKQFPDEKPRPHFDEDEPVQFTRSPTSIAPKVKRMASVRKYSAQWRRRTWDTWVMGGKWPRVIYVVVLGVLLVTWIGVMVGFAITETNWQTRNTKVSPKFNAHPLEGRNTSRPGYLFLEGTLVSFDPVNRLMTVQWAGKYQNGSTDPIDAGDPNVPDSWWQRGVGIYRDVDAYPQQFPLPWLNGSYSNISTNSESSSSTPRPGWQYMYAIDDHTATPVGVIGRRIWDSFNTEISMGQVSKSAWRQPSFGYPFDQWEGSIVFVANNQEWASLDNITGGDVIELAGMTLAGSVLNMYLTFKFENSCESTYTIDPNNLTTFNKSCHLEINFHAKRPILVKVLTTIAVIINWVCALFVFLLTSEAIIMRRAYMVEGTDLLSVCFTALFALPTVRSLLPGAPDFGAMNLIGIIPNVIIIALSTCVVTIAKLYRTQEREAAREERLAMKAEKGE